MESVIGFSPVGEKHPYRGQAVFQEVKIDPGHFCGSSPGPMKTTRYFTLLSPRHQSIHHLGLGQGRGVSEFVNGAFRNLSQDPSHDLSTSGLGKGIGEMQLVRRCDRPDLLPHVVNEFLFELIGCLETRFQRDKGVNALPLDLMRETNHCRF
jgi:hypothetical protein